MFSNPNTPSNQVQYLVDDYYELLQKSRSAETNSLTDQLCGFTDLIKGLVERQEQLKAITALGMLRELLTKLRSRLDLTDSAREASHRELIELAVTHDLPVSAAIIQKETALIVKG